MTWVDKDDARVHGKAVGPLVSVEMFLEGLAEDVEGKLAAGIGSAGRPRLACEGLLERRRTDVGGARGDNDTHVTVDGLRAEGRA